MNTRCAIPNETVKIEDVAAKDSNREILRKLAGNDALFKSLKVCNSDGRPGGSTGFPPPQAMVYSSFGNYSPEGDNDLALLGYYIGKSNCLEELAFLSWSNPLDENCFNFSDIEPFLRGLNSNRTIRKISFYDMDCLGKFFLSISHFFAKNSNLHEISVVDCHFGDFCASQFSSVVRGCCRSLKSFLDLTHAFSNWMNGPRMPLQLSLIISGEKLWRD